MISTQTRTATVLRESLGAYLVKSIQDTGQEDAAGIVAEVAGVNILQAGIKPAHVSDKAGIAAPGGSNRRDRDSSNPKIWLPSPYGSSVFPEDEVSIFIPWVCR